jgi:cytochrome c
VTAGALIQIQQNPMIWTISFGKGVSMKSLSVPKSMFFALLVAALLQFACGVGAPAPSSNSQPPPSDTQPTQAAPATSASVSERGTPAEAQAMLKLAVEHYQQVGRDQALADFNAGQAPFMDRDLYVACSDSNHITLANGGFPTLVGISVDSVLTTEGQPLGKITWERASTDSVNSVNYHWVNPVSGKTEPKTLFFQKLDANDVCGVGAYNP